MNRPEFDVRRALPAAARAAMQPTENFRYETPMPKGVSRHLIAQAVDKVLRKQDATVQYSVLTKSELGVVEDIVAKFLQWERAQQTPAPEATP